MTDAFVSPLNERGLFVHRGAQDAIEAFVRDGQVLRRPGA